MKKDYQRWSIDGTQVYVDETIAPTRIPGESDSWRLIFEDDGNFSTDAIDRYRELVNLGRVGGSIQTEVTQTNQLIYRERLRTDAPAPNVVVEFSPVQSIAQSGGFWATIDGYADNSVLKDAGDTHEIDLDFTYIAETSTYSTRSDLESAFSGDVI